MAVDRTHLCRRVESTPPHWKIQGWKVESIRRSSSSKYDILITTPPPGSQKIRSLKGLTRFITEHNITTLSVEDLNSRKQSISWKKTALEGICRCVGPKTRATPNSLQLAPAVDKCRELRDGIVEESRDSGEREQLPVGTELGFEVHLAGRGNLPRGVTAGPETQSAVCVTEAEMLDADSELKTEESLVSKVVGDCDPTHVPLLSVRSAEVLVGGVAAHDRTVGRASVDGGCGEECEDVGSSPSSGSHCSTGTWVPTTTEGDSIVDKVKTEGGHEESQSTDGGTSPERVQGAGGRSRRKQQGQCVSPYFRKSGRVVSSLPQCVLKRSKWLPPRSPFGLIQEDLYHDPFQLLVATVLLNKTRGEAATPVIWKLLEKWPTAEDILKAAEEDLVSLIQPLGLQRRRAFIIKKFADEFLCKLWTYPDELYGISKYGADSYRIFCVDEWQHTRPTDHMLLKYVKWLADKRIS